MELPKLKLDLADIDYIYFILIFIIPGFIINYIQRTFKPEKYEFELLAFLQFFTYSLVYNAVFFPITNFIAKFLLKNHIVVKNNFGLWFYWMLLLFVLPAILGLFMVAVKPKKLIEKLFNMMNIDVKFQTNTAWDDVFYDLQCKITEQEKPFLLTVTLNDGSQINGLYGTSSKTSYGRDNSDLFIEKVLTIDENDEFEELEGQSGILIKGDKIKHIEFIELEEE